MLSFRVHVPAPPPGLVSNVVGLLGLLGVAFAVAALTDWRWGVLTLSVCAVVLAGLAQARSVPAARPVPTLMRPAASGRRAA